ELGVAGDGASGEQRRARRVRGRIGVGDRGRKGPTRGLRRRPFAGYESHRRERKTLRDACDVTVPGERDATGQRGGEVVRVALELEARGEEPLGRRRPPRRRGGE